MDHQHQRIFSDKKTDTKYKARNNGTRKPGTLNRNRKSETIFLKWNKIIKTSLRLENIDLEDEKSTIKSWNFEKSSKRREYYAQRYSFWGIKQQF